MSGSLTTEFRILELADILAMPYLQWAAQGIFPLKGVAIVYGASGTGKSFLVLDLAAKLALGRSWFGFPVRERLRVTLFALEGKDGLRKRVEGWAKRNEVSFPAEVSYVVDPFALGDDGELERALRKIKIAGSPDVVIIDTLNRASPLVDENRSSDMGKLIRGASRLQAELDGLVILVHHTGKDESRGPRGHSSLFAAMDVVVAVQRDGDTDRYWRLEKAKDGEDGVSRKFELAAVEVARDDYETPITSAAVLELDEEAPVQSKKVRLGKHQDKVLAELHMQLLAQEQDPKRSPNEPLGFPYENVVLSVQSVVDVEDPSRRKERTRDALDSLIKIGKLVLIDNYVRLPA